MCTSCQEKIHGKSYDVVIDGNIINNYSNNYQIGGDLCRIKDRLYFNYQKNGLDYGLIEISDKYAKKITHQTFQLKDEVKLNNPLLVENGTLYSMTRENIICFSMTENTFVTLAPISGYGVGNLYVVDNHSYIYIMSDLPSTAGNIVLQDRETKRYKTIVSNDVTCFFLKGNIIYYAAVSKDANRIYKYDMQTHENNLICELRNSTIYYLLFSNNNLIFYSTDDHSINNIYRINVDENVEELDLIYSSSNIEMSMNCYNNDVYVCDHGLTKINFYNKEKVILSQKNCAECYIVDDKWVYFVDYNSNLWRVTQDGDNLQKIYG